MTLLLRFILDGLREMLRGSAAYWRWLGFLGLLVVAGLWGYAGQLRDGLVVTGLSDQVSWGLYISNFAFLVGIAAAAVLLVIPAYLFHRQDVKQVVLLGEGLAVAAVIAAMLFVLVDLGRIDRAWHLIPFIGRFNWPSSLLAWDVLVLNGYLALNVALPMYVHFCHYRGREPDLRLYFPFVVLAMLWAISIHTVTAFLFSANSARPFWNTSLLGPRFIASAFASGPALIILLLQLIRRVTDYPVKQSVIDTLALVMTVSLQISLFFVGAELFTDFYNESRHAGSIRYLFFGLDGLHSLRPWIWTALALNVVAVLLLSVHRTRRWMPTLNLACALTFVGIWIEKGMGLVVPGFIPTPLGEVFEYTPTLREIIISVGIWAFGALVFTLLAKASIAIELGRVRAAACAGARGRAYDGVFSTQLSTVFRSASLIFAASTGAIGSLPHTPMLPLRTRSVSCAIAPALPLYLAATSFHDGPISFLSAAWQMAQPAFVEIWAGSAAWAVPQAAARAVTSTRRSMVFIVDFSNRCGVGLCCVNNSRHSICTLRVTLYTKRSGPCASS